MKKKIIPETPSQESKNDKHTHSRARMFLTL